jgi:glutathione S-transferase
LRGAFHAHNSTCSQKVRLCLAENGIRDWISRPVDISNRENLSPEYLAINPNGVVPAFRHNGRSIIESAVMCEYLDDLISHVCSKFACRASAHARVAPLYR